MYNIEIKKIIGNITIFVQQELTHVKENRLINHIVNLTLKVLLSTINKWYFLSHVEIFFVEHNKLRKYRQLHNYILYDINWDVHGFHGWVMKKHFKVE